MLLFEVRITTDHRHIRVCDRFDEWGWWSQELAMVIIYLVLYGALTHLLAKDFYIGRSPHCGCVAVCIFHRANMVLEC